MDMGYKQLINFKYLQYKSNYLPYKLNSLEQHEHGKYCGSAPHPAHQQQSQLIWKGASSSWKIQKKD